MVAVREVTPTFRIFDDVKPLEFYVDFPGFQIDREDWTEPDLPLSMRVSRRDLVLHLSEHHGDGCSGAG